MRACTSCRHLKDCSVVDENKIVTGYHCSAWERVAESEMNARFQIERDFGSWALRFENPKLQTVKSASPKMRRRHRNG